MPSLDCPTCMGSGYVQQDDDTTMICARCDGTGVLFVDEDAGDTWTGAEG
jgi:DnaJ-class molecular chaperone